MPPLLLRRLPEAISLVCIRERERVQIGTATSRYQSLSSEIEHLITSLYVGLSLRAFSKKKCGFALYIFLVLFRILFYFENLLFES